MWLRDVNDVMHRKRARRIFGIWKKVSWVKFLPLKKMVDFRGSPRPCGGCRTWFGADGKVVIERLCLSLPHVEKSFNSKVIKSFIPELRSRQVFFVFRDSYVIYMCVMNILCTFHISVSWVCYTSALVRQLVSEKENSEYKPIKLRLKIDLVSYPSRAEGLVYIYIYIYMIVFFSFLFIIGCSHLCIIEVPVV